MLKRLLKLFFIVGIFGVMFTGCVIVNDCCDTYYKAYMDIYISDTIVYDSRGNRYEAIYAEVLGEKVYDYQSFWLEKDYSYNLKYAYYKNGEMYVDYISIDLYDNAYITVKGNEIRIEYH